MPRLRSHRLQRAFRQRSIAFGRRAAGSRSSPCGRRALPLRAMIWPRPYVAWSTHMPWRNRSGSVGGAGRPPLAKAAAVVNRQRTARLRRRSSRAWPVGVHGGPSVVVPILIAAATGHRRLVGFEIHAMIRSAARAKGRRAQVGYRAVSRRPALRRDRSRPPFPPAAIP